MSIITVDLPGLEPHHAQDLVRMALNEWQGRRGDNYVERRYAHMDQAYRDRRAARLELETAALASSMLDVQP